MPVNLQSLLDDANFRLFSISSQSPQRLASLSVWCRSQWRTLMFERRQSAPTRPLKFFHSLTNCSICNLAGKVKHPDTSWYVRGRIDNEEKPLTWKAHSSKTSNWKLCSISVLLIEPSTGECLVGFSTPAISRWNWKYFVTWKLLST